MNTYRKSEIPDHLQKWFEPAEIGLEESPEDFVASLVDVFREVKRVLRPDGTLWVNLGDSYAGSGKGCCANKEAVLESQHRTKHLYVPTRDESPLSGNVPKGLKPKDLVGIPWRVAFALQADGWYLRSDIIWSKSNPMPESVTDRPTKAHEYVFLFAHPDSGGKYFYDADAVKEPVSSTNPKIPWRERTYGTGQGVGELNGEGSYKRGTSRQPCGNPDNGMRNKRSVWTVNPKPYKGSHFAVWPPDLVRPMILAGTSAHGVCAKCGAPWNHEVLREVLRDTAPVREMPKTPLNIVRAGWRNAPAPKVLRDAWVPTCNCVDAQTIPATVLDPFSGSATTGMVALQEGRNYIGLDLNPDYLPLAEARVQELPAPEVHEDASVGDIFDLFGGGA